MFIIEKILGSRLIKKARYGDIFVTEVGLLPSGVSFMNVFFFSLPAICTVLLSSSYVNVCFSDICTGVWYEVYISKFVFKMPHQALISY